MSCGLRPRLRPRGASAPEGGLSGPEGEAERAAQKEWVSGNSGPLWGATGISLHGSSHRGETSIYPGLFFRIGPNVLPRDSM